VEAPRSCRLKCETRTVRSKPATTTACPPHEPLLCHEVVPRTAPCLTWDTGQTLMLTSRRNFPSRFKPPNWGRARVAVFSERMGGEAASVLSQAEGVHSVRACPLVGQGHRHEGPGHYVPNQRAPDLATSEHSAPPARLHPTGCLSKTKSAKLELAGAYRTRVTCLLTCQQRDGGPYCRSRQSLHFLPERPELSVLTGLGKSYASASSCRFLFTEREHCKVGPLGLFACKIKLPPANLIFPALPPWLHALERPEMGSLPRREASKLTRDMCYYCSVT